MSDEEPGDAGAKPKPAADSAPGSPGDALKPLGDALLAAAKAAGAEPTGDPRVTATVQLGWLMEDLLVGRALTAFPSDLAISPEAGFKAQGRQLTTILAALKLQLVDPVTLVGQLDAGAAATAQAADWQSELAAALFAADGRLAKAYSVGRQLNSLTHMNSEAAFKDPGVAMLAATLDALSTALPPHGARGVANSMRRWVALTAPPDDIGHILPAQGELWRSLLAGEKKGTEFLEPENYLDAADRVGAKLRAAAAVALKRFGGLVVLIVLLFALGVALLAAKPVHAGTTAAGLSGVLAAVGLTWKGIGGTIGKLAGKLEAPLWGAEVDEAIADAVTLVEQPAPKVSIRTRRRTVTSGDYAGRADRAKGTITK